MLNRPRPAAVGGKAQTGSPRWRSRGYRCIGGVLYKVSANKLSKTSGRPSGDGGSKPLLRAGEAPRGLWAQSLQPCSEAMAGTAPTSTRSEGGLPRWRSPRPITPAGRALGVAPRGSGWCHGEAPGTTRVHRLGVSCLAELPPIFRGLLLDKGDEPGTVNTARAREHLGLRRLIALATPPNCVWRRPLPHGRSRGLREQAEEREMLWIHLLYKLTRKRFWFQSNFTPFLSVQKKKNEVAGGVGIVRAQRPAGPAQGGGGVGSSQRPSSKPCLSAQGLSVGPAACCQARCVAS